MLYSKCSALCQIACQLWHFMQLAKLKRLNLKCLKITAFAFSNSHCFHIKNDPTTTTAPLRLTILMILVKTVHHISVTTILCGSELMCRGSSWNVGRAIVCLFHSWCTFDVLPFLCMCKVRENSLPPLSNTQVAGRSGMAMCQWQWGKWSWRGRLRLGVSSSCSMTIWPRLLCKWLYMAGYQCLKPVGRPVCALSRQRRLLGGQSGSLQVTDEETFFIDRGKK